MKKILSIFLICVIALNMCACSGKEDSTKTLLTAVLNNEKTFINEKGEAVLLKDYALGKGELAIPLYADPTEYTFVDMDNNGTDELVINVSTGYGAYLVLCCNGFDIYGYEFGVRAFHQLKTDGSFIGSGGAASEYFCRLSFEDNKANVIYTAVKDSNIGRFELDGKECSIQELNEYINDWNLKEDVKWVKINSSTTTPDNQTGDNTDKDSDKDSGKTNNSNTESKVIDLNKYVVVSFTGDNLAGYSSVEFDKEKFLLDHKNNVSFNKDNLQVYRELYGNDETIAASSIIKHFSVRLDKYRELSNGDSVKITWEIETEKIKNYFECQYTCSTEVVTVSGLKDAKTFDPFAEIEVNFTGISPYGSATATVVGFGYGGTYKVSSNGNLKNGDKVTVTYYCEDKATMIARYGKYPATTQKTYTVSGLNSYAQSMGSLSPDQQKKIVAKARSLIWVTGYGEYPDAKFCGYYFYTAKGKEAHGVHFLSWCGTPVGNAICLVFEHPRNYEEENSPNVYTVIKLENIVIKENGEMIDNRYEMTPMNNYYESKEELRSSFVGVFDDIMNCSDRTSFN